MNEGDERPEETAGDFEQIMQSRRCLRCGGELLEMGSLASHVLSFRPARSTFWTLQPNVALHAILCMECGTVELIGDINKAAALIGRPSPE